MSPYICKLGNIEFNLAKCDSIYTERVTPDFRRGTKCISYVRQDQFTHI
jgi:hypothetical protein